MDYDYRHVRQEEDLVLQTLYCDRHILAASVLPGLKTIREFPVMEKKEWVFKKEYLTRDAQPLKRGEFPEVEWARAVELAKAVPNLPIPEAYGAKDLVFYGELIYGKELEKLSPFHPDLEKSLTPTGPPPFGWKTYLEGLGHFREQLLTMHGQGYAHGDMHTGNILVGPEGRCFMIDLGSVTGGASPDEQLDDLVEIERELALAAFHAKVPLGDLSHSLESLFPERVAAVMEEAGLAMATGKGGILR